MKMVTCSLLCIIFLLVYGCSTSAPMRASLPHHQLEEPRTAAAREYVFIVAPIGQIAPAAPTAERAGSIQTEDGRRLPLREHHVEAGIHGFLATVDLRQRFAATADADEVRYVLPLTQGSLIRDAVITIGGGDREIRAVIRPRDEAEAAYTAARRAGFKATLITQETGDEFALRFAHIAAGSVIDVHLQYLQTLTWAHLQRALELHIPLPEGVKPDISATLSTLAVGTVTSPTHHIQSFYSSATQSIRVGEPTHSSARAATFVLRITALPEIAHLVREDAGWSYHALMVLPSKTGRTTPIQLRINGSPDILPESPTAIPADRPLISIWRQKTESEFHLRIADQDAQTLTSGGGAGLSALWAALRIQKLLQDPTAEHLAEARELALEFSIVTPATALITVDATHPPKK